MGAAQGGSSTIPPTPKDDEGPSAASDENGSPDTPDANVPQNAYAADYAQQQGMQPYPGMGMYPMMSPPMHIPGHVFQPFTPGSASSTMSPGVFFRPDPHRHGPYMNGAVGSPVMPHAPLGGYYVHPGSQPGSPYCGVPIWPHAQQIPPQQQSPPQQEEYFPSIPAQKQESYFPPVPSTLGASGLANEIMRDGSTMLEGRSGESSRNGSGDGAAYLANDINALSLGSAMSDSTTPALKQQTKTQSPSYAAIASTRPNRAGSSSSSGSTSGQAATVAPASAPGARHNSMDSSSKTASGRPAPPQKTSSDEGAHGTGKSDLLFSY